MADVTLTNTVPEIHVPTVLNSANALGGETVAVSWKNTRIRFEIPNREAGEDDKPYVERVNRRIFWKILQMVDTVYLTEVRNDEIAALPPVESEIPEDVVVETP